MNSKRNNNKFFKAFTFCTTLIATTLLMTGCLFATEKIEEKSISAEEILDILGQDQRLKTINLIDLRTPKEVESTGTIPGAQVINFQSVDFEISLKNLDRKKTYIVYCKAGGRSAKAAEKMKKLGFNVKDYSEGMDGWLAKKNKTRPVVN